MAKEKEKSNVKDIEVKADEVKAPPIFLIEEEDLKKVNGFISLAMGAKQKGMLNAEAALEGLVALLNDVIKVK